MTPFIKKLTQDILNVVAERQAAEKLVESLEQKQNDIKTKILDIIFPISSKKGELLPIDSGVFIAVEKIRLLKETDKDDDTPFKWEAEGNRISFKNGLKIYGRSTTIKQEDWNNLADNIKQQDPKEAADTLVLKVDLTTPLKITPASKAMFEYLPPEKGRIRRGGVWDNENRTHAIYAQFVKTGVIHIIKGEPGSYFDQWLVEPGPRFNEFKQLIKNENNSTIISPKNKLGKKR